MGIEPAYKGFADPRLTTWLQRRTLLLLILSLERKVKEGDAFDSQVLLNVMFDFRSAPLGETQRGFRFAVRQDTDEDGSSLTVI